VSFLSPNIGQTGRIFRGISGVGLLIAAVIMAWHVWWIALILGIAGAFGIYEALRGWCFLRACGIKTKL
jgi:hypothetical protein